MPQDKSGSQSPLSEFETLLLKNYISNYCGDSDSRADTYAGTLSDNLSSEHGVVFKVDTTHDVYNIIASPATADLNQPKTSTIHLSKLWETIYSQYNLHMGSPNATSRFFIPVMIAENKKHPSYCVLLEVTYVSDETTPTVQLHIPLKRKKIKDGIKKLKAAIPKELAHLLKVNYLPLDTDSKMDTSLSESCVAEILRAAVSLDKKGKTIQVPNLRKAPNLKSSKQTKMLDSITSHLAPGVAHAKSKFTFPDTTTIENKLQGIKFEEVNVKDLSRLFNKGNVTLLNNESLDAYATEIYKQFSEEFQKNFDLNPFTPEYEKDQKVEVETTHSALCAHARTIFYDAGGKLKSFMADAQSKLPKDKASDVYKGIMSGWINLMMASAHNPKDSIRPLLIMVKDRNISPFSSIVNQFSTPPASVPPEISGIVKEEETAPGSAPRKTETTPEDELLDQFKQAADEIAFWLRNAKNNLGLGDNSSKISEKKKNSYNLITKAGETYNKPNDLAYLFSQAKKELKAKNPEEDTQRATSLLEYINWYCNYLEQKTLLKRLESIGKKGTAKRTFEEFQKTLPLSISNREHSRNHQPERITGIAGLVKELDRLDIDTTESNDDIQARRKEVREELDQRYTDASSPAVSDPVLFSFTSTKEAISKLLTSLENTKEQLSKRYEKSKDEKSLRYYQKQIEIANEYISDVTQLEGQTTTTPRQLQSNVDGILKEIKANTAFTQHAPGWFSWLWRLLRRTPNTLKRLKRIFTTAKESAAAARSTLDQVFLEEAKTFNETATKPIPAAATTSEVIVNIAGELGRTSSTSSLGSNEDEPLNTAEGKLEGTVPAAQPVEPPSNAPEKISEQPSAPPQPGFPAFNPATDIVENDVVPPYGQNPNLLMPQGASSPKIGKRQNPLDAQNLPDASQIQPASSTRN